MTLSWQILGSSLWLRPLAAPDRARVRAFLARGGLLSGGDAPDPDTPKTAPGAVLLATDPLGAPTGVFRVFEARGTAGPVGRVGFTVHADDLPHLREALRLLAETARTRTGWGRLVIASVPAHPDLTRTLFEAGWDREGKTWVHPIDRERAPSPTETAHAG